MRQGRGFLYLCIKSVIKKWFFFLLTIYSQSISAQKLGTDSIRQLISKVYNQTNGLMSLEEYNQNIKFINTQITEILALIENRLFENRFNFKINDKSYTYETYLDYVAEGTLYKEYKNVSWWDPNIDKQLFNALRDLKYIDRDTNCLQIRDSLISQIVQTSSKKPPGFRIKEIVLMFTFLIESKSQPKHTDSGLKYYYPDVTTFYEENWHYLYDVFLSAKNYKEYLECQISNTNFLYHYAYYKKANEHLLTVLSLSAYNNFFQYDQFYSIVDEIYYLGIKTGNMEILSVFGEQINSLKKLKEKQKANSGISNTLRDFIHLTYIDEWLKRNAESLDTGTSIRIHIIKVNSIINQINNLIRYDMRNLDCYELLYQSAILSKRKTFEWQKICGQIFFEQSLLSYINIKDGIWGPTMREFFFNKVLFAYLLKGDYHKGVDFFHKYISLYPHGSSLTMLATLTNTFPFDQKHFQVDMGKGSLFYFINTLSDYSNDSNFIHHNISELNHSIYVIKLNYFKGSIWAKYGDFNKNFDSLKHYYFLSHEVKNENNELKGRNSEFASQFPMQLLSVNQQKEIESLNEFKKQLKERITVMVKDSTILGKRYRGQLQLNDSLYKKNDTLSKRNETLLKKSDTLKRINRLMKFFNEELKNSISDLKSWRRILFYVGATLLIFILVQIVTIFRLKKTKTKLILEIEKLEIKEKKLSKNIEGLEETVKANERANKIQTLLRNTNDHDVDNAYKNLKKEITDENLSDVPEILSKLSIINEYADSYRVYKCQYNSTDPISHITTIESDILAAQKYIPLFLNTYKKEKIQINLDVQKIPPSLLNLSIPHKLIHNFILNSIKHGMEGRSKIDITINAFEENNRVNFQILDDGCGFDVTQDVFEKGNGFKLIRDLISIYNSEKSEKYMLNFALSKVYVYSEKGNGTKIYFNLTEKGS